MGLSQYFHMYLQTSVFVVSNGASLMSIACSILEIRPPELTHASQTHEIWLSSGAHCSKSNDTSTCIYKHQSLRLYPMVQVSSIACSGLEIRPHEFTHASQIHEIWLISGAHSSKADGVVTILPHTFINLHLFVSSGASLVSIACSQDMPA